MKGKIPFAQTFTQHSIILTTKKFQSRHCQRQQQFLPSKMETVQFHHRRHIGLRRMKSAIASYINLSQPVTVILHNKCTSATGVEHVSQRQRLHPPSPMARLRHREPRKHRDQMDRAKAIVDADLHGLISLVAEAQQQQRAMKWLFMEK